MSVLIKGMDMPKGCSRCTLLYRGSDERYHCPFNSFCVWLDFDDIPDYIVDDDCPLVSVPTPHGRLVDADEITKDMNTFQDSFVINVSGGRFGEISCTAKTIVESEE